MTLRAWQAWVGVVPLGPAGCALNSSFANRESQAYREDLGNALVNLARMVPDGMLVFFPSYVVLRGCIDAWKASYGSGQSWGSSIWERITAHKQPVIEPQVPPDSCIRSRTPCCGSAHGCCAQHACEDLLALREPMKP